MKLIHMLSRLNFMSAWEAKREYKKQRERALGSFVKVFNSLVNSSIKHGTRYITITKPNILTVKDFEILIKELGYNIEARNLGSYKISYRDNLEKRIQIVKLK